MEEFGLEFLAGHAPPETATHFRVPFFRLRPALTTRPLLRLPDEPVALVFDFLCTVPDRAAASRTLECNRQFYQRLQELRRSLSSIGATQLTHRHWQAHFGP